MTAPYRRPQAEPHQRFTARRKTDGTRDKVREAFMKAWEDGVEFNITLTNEGNVKVQVRKKTVCFYEDAEAFAKDMFDGC